jgi:hypothetical protein
LIIRVTLTRERPRLSAVSWWVKPNSKCNRATLATRSDASIFVSRTWWVLARSLLMSPTRAMKLTPPLPTPSERCAPRSHMFHEFYLLVRVGRSPIRWASHRGPPDPNIALRSLWRFDTKSPPDVSVHINIRSILPRARHALAFVEHGLLLRIPSLSWRKLLIT